MTVAGAPRTISSASRIAVPAALATATAWLGALGVAGHVWQPALVLGGAILGVATLASTSRGLLAQVFARAVGWLTFVPSVAAVAMLIAMRESPLNALPFALASGAALWAGLPLLHSKEAHEPFAPVRFRRAWLAAATSSFAAAIPLAFVGIQMMRHGSEIAGFGIAALAAGLVTSAVAVLRMRGYGVLLGGATALGLLVAALFAGATGALALTLAAIPAALLAAPVLLARVLPDEGASSRATPHVRIADDLAGASSAPVRSRIADTTTTADPLAAADTLETTDTREDAPPAARARAAESR